MKMAEPTKESARIILESEPRLRDSSWEGDGRTREGWVGTKDGIVLAYVAQEGKTLDGPRTVLRFTAGGKVHTWTYPRAYRDRHVGRLASRMARVLTMGGD